jgi:uridine kinase
MPDDGNGGDITLVTRHGQKPVQKLPLEAGVKSVMDRITELESRISRPIIVEIAGGSGSGKTTVVANKLKEKFQDRALLVSMDDYFIGVSRVNALGINLDHPDAVDLDLLKEHLRLMKAGKWVDKPIYEYETGKRTGTERIDPKRIIIIEGIFALNEKVASEGDIRVFVDVGAHGRIIRRLMRDSKRPNMFSAPLLSMQYMTNVVEPMYQEHIAPTRQNADIIIENNYDPNKEAENTGVIEAQRKYKVDIDAETLRKIGASRISSANQTDYYYTSQDGSFEDAKEMLRIRKENKKAIFTYKGPKKPSSNATERYKFEFEIDGETEQGIASVYAIKPKVITKDRTVYYYKGIVFSVDTDVYKTENGSRTELGNFIEVTVPQSKSEIEALAELLRGLRINQSSMVLKSYDEM